jgi:hypothetical protein
VDVGVVNVGLDGVWMLVWMMCRGRGTNPTVRYGGTVLVPLVDPDAVAAAFRAGVGGEILGQNFGGNLDGRCVPRLKVLKSNGKVVRSNGKVVG